MQAGHDLSIFLKNPSANYQFPGQDATAYMEGTENAEASMSFFDLAGQNILSPMVLFFVLGAALSLARSDLSIPGSVAKLLSLYLMMSIGFRGGVEVAHHGLLRHAWPPRWWRA